MAGTKIGSEKAVATIYVKYGSDYFSKLGVRGGTRSRTGGFWYKKYVLGDTESIRRAGMLGGRMSRRGKNKLTEKERREIRKAYEHLLAVHMKAKRERARYSETQLLTPRTDGGAITVFDRKRGLVREQVA